MKTVYYFDRAPKSARIVSQSIGIDKTIFPTVDLIREDDDRKETVHYQNPADRIGHTYYARILRLAANPQIDHIFVEDDSLYVEDEEEKLIDAGPLTLDLCDDKICLEDWYVWDKKRKEKFYRDFDAAQEKRTAWLQKHPEAYDEQAESDFIAAWIGRLTGCTSASSYPISGGDQLIRQPSLDQLSIES